MEMYQAASFGRVETILSCGLHISVPTTVLTELQMQINICRKNGER